MTSLTATAPSATATPRLAARPARTGALRDAPWVRAALGVVVGGLLVADLSVVLRERADAAAAGRQPVPALRADAASTGSRVARSSPALTSYFDEVVFTDAIARAVAGAPVAVAPPATAAVAEIAAPATAAALPATTTAEAVAAPILPAAPAVPVGVVPATTAPGDAPPPGQPASPLVPPAGDAGPAVTGIVATIPLVGPTLAPAVSSVVSGVTSVVDAVAGTAAPAQASPVAGLADPVLAPASSLPIDRSGLPG